MTFFFYSGSLNAQFNKIFDFSTTTSGQNPQGCLTSDGTFLYGTTRYGGVSGDGTIFKIMPDGSGYVKLFDFNGSDGSSPLGALVYDGTYLYGTTISGGSGIYGTVFKIKPDGTGFLQLFDFGTTSLAGAMGGLIYDGTFLLGTTYTGGTPGSIFKIKTDGTGFTQVYDCTDGIHPYTPYYDGTFLYEMTSAGGMNSKGIIFKVKPDGSGYSKLLDFSGTLNGAHPEGSFYFDGTYLYGMTTEGGTANLGTIFKIKPDGTGFSKLLDFTGSMNGAGPYGALIFDGTFLHGTTKEGGLTNFGTIFKIKPDGSSFSKLFDFDGISGKNPFNSLFTDGISMYGMTFYGGANNDGSLFKYGLTTGISEPNSPDLINVFPNPNSGQFSFSGLEGENSISIYDRTGKMIFNTDRIKNSNFKVDLTPEAKGIYLFRIEKEGKLIKTGKLSIE
jgi:uncharacterized repeat protein (TIGR03803 family)